MSGSRAVTSKASDAVDREAGLIEPVPLAIATFLLCCGLWAYNPIFPRNQPLNDFMARLFAFWLKHVW
jgi:hypothetical protein